LLPAEAPGVFDHIIVNKDLQMAYQKLRATVTQVISLVETLYTWGVYLLTCSSHAQELGLAKKKTSPNTTAAKS
jgi:hypothetical protein